MAIALLATALAACSDSDERSALARHERSASFDERWPSPSLHDPGPGTGLAAGAVRAIHNAHARALTPLIERIARAEGADPTLVHAVISQESGYNPRAVSSAGAAGLMQLMPGTAADYGLTPDERFDPAKNIRAGVRYLKYLQRLFHGNLDLVLAAYNAGQGNVIKYGRRIPPFRETRDYVRKVKGYYAHYRQRARHARTRGLLAEAGRRNQLQRSLPRERLDGPSSQGVQ